MAVLLDARSMKSDDELVTEDCHLYSSVPIFPEGNEVLVNSAGAVPEQMVWFEAITPPEPGLAQTVLVRVKVAPDAPAADVATL